MKAPFFLLGFFAMLISICAFAKVEEDRVHYEQKVKNIVPGMNLTFPEGFSLEFNGNRHATAELRRAAEPTRLCTVSLESKTNVRLQSARSWTVDRSDTAADGTHTLELSADVEGKKRSMRITCSTGEISNDLFRVNDVLVPYTRPVKVDVIRFEGETLPQHDDTATTAI